MAHPVNTSSQGPTRRARSVVAIRGTAADSVHAVNGSLRWGTNLTTNGTHRAGRWSPLEQAKVKLPERLRIAIKLRSRQTKNRRTVTVLVLNPAEVLLQEDFIMHGRWERTFV